MVYWNLSGRGKEFIYILLGGRCGEDTFILNKRRRGGPMSSTAAIVASSDQRTDGPSFESKRLARYLLHPASTLNSLNARAHHPRRRHLSVLGPV